MVAAGLALAAFGGLAGVAWSGFSQNVARRAPRLTFSRLTLLDGVAEQAMISPDGKWVAYVSDASGNPDIYLQSTTGQTAINLTKDSPAADTMPAFSTDGEFIAFRSERDGGGLFVMGRTGESVRRLTKSGFQPAWFPDGRRLAFVSLPGINPDARAGSISELWTVDAAGGEPQRIHRGDAVQPRVSPNGRRIAFWAMAPSEDFTSFANPNRDVWTVALDGTDPVRVTTEEATDWNPVWSPDGTGLYFLSNRSGSMNLWRVGIDEVTGATTGADGAHVVRQAL
jgi:Tol biopolymer transport system component